MMNQNIQSLSNWSKMASCSAMAVGVCMTYVASQALQCCNERTAKCALMAISSSRVLQVGVALSAASILLLYKSDSQIHQAQVALERLNTMKEGALTTLRNGLEAAERLHAAQSEKVKALNGQILEKNREIAVLRATPQHYEDRMRVLKDQVRVLRLEATKQASYMKGQAALILGLQAQLKKAQSPNPPPPLLKYVPENDSV